MNEHDWVHHSLERNRSGATAEWVRDPRTGIYDLDGVSWSDAPLPPRIHKCSAQTRGRDGFRIVLRCPCGGINDTGGHGLWVFKNERRKGWTEDE